MSKNSQLDLLPDEKILFYSPNKDRWEGYRFDLMAYIVIGGAIVPYVLTLLTLLDILGLVTYFNYTISKEERVLWTLTFIFASIIYTFIVIQYYKSLKVYRYNYPLVLTNKRIILEKDFLSKKKPIGTFIEGAEKIAYIEVTKRESFIYFKKDGKIVRVPLSYLSKYKEEFKEALRNLFGERYVERTLWKEKIPLNKKLINEIFQEEG